MIEAIIVFIIMLVTCFIGYQRKSLSLSGAFAAFLTGAVILAGFGVRGLAVLGVFYVTSSFWSKFKASRKVAVEEKLAKGSTRDWRQVAANGGAAALFSMMELFHPMPLWLIGFCVCLAAANSDTWASEIGTLSKLPPIDIRTFKRIERGTSGAVSFLGSMAAVIGSIVVSLVSLILFNLPISGFFIISSFGFLGNIIDTLLGAFLQQAFVCSICGIATERRIHCNHSTNRIKGMAFVENDMVNFFSGFLAAWLALIAAVLFN